MKGPVQRSSSAWKAWIPALVWLGVIAIESTASLSSENTGRFLYPIFHFLFGLDPVRFITWHFLIRKTGHVVGYAILSLLLFRAWRATIVVKNDPRWSLAWARAALGMTALVASLDEWHQTFLPSRTGTIHDVVLDTAAGLGAQILLYLWFRGNKTGAPETPQGGSPVHRFAEPASHQSSNTLID